MRILILLILLTFMVSCKEKTSKIEIDRIERICKIKLPVLYSNFAFKESIRRDTCIDIKFKMAKMDIATFLSNSRFTKIDTAMKMKGFFDTTFRYHSSISWFNPTDTSVFLEAEVYEESKSSSWSSRLVIDITQPESCFVYINALH